MRTTRRNPLARSLAKYVVTARISETELVTPTMQWIRLVADQPISFAYRPGQHIRVQLHDPLSLYGIVRPAETLRTYTIWRFDPAERAVELRAHLYEGDGIGLRWVRSVRPGDPVTFWWPQSDYHTGDASYHLFAGEETASAAFGPMTAALAASERVYGVLESENPAQDPPMPGPHQFHRVYRHGASAVASEALINAVTTLDLPADPGAAYLAGEARTCQRIRDHLVRDRGWPRTAIKVKPFWAVGKRGLH
ncbi:NADPH-dependent ferric siderophore reductase [Tamaricihabitans halophyticus]|uniref:NADPH-dependent ferric siderophore reductase n=1 Tax=Tamaricihabitans halophyticus TaxID=1262583 RepID=A0A4R2QGW9_9PSEU|nr:siderophore-interacting protein [Tamaricihabitans halophyticus]TCP48480.1 NADPH-dependent ferric siderophore reductase [Tamaricihabitans halophyticus]